MKGCLQSRPFTPLFLWGGVARPSRGGSRPNRPQKHACAAVSTHNTHARTHSCSISLSLPRSPSLALRLSLSLLLSSLYIYISASLPLLHPLFAPPLYPPLPLPSFLSLTRYLALPQPLFFHPFSLWRSSSLPPPHPFSLPPSPSLLPPLPLTLSLSFPLCVSPSLSPSSFPSLSASSSKKKNYKRHTVPRDTLQQNQPTLL